MAVAAHPVTANHTNDRNQMIHIYIPGPVLHWYSQHQLKVWGQLREWSQCGVQGEDTGEAEGKFKKKN